MNNLFPNLQQQLNKLSIRKMQYRITEIDIDFEDDNYELSSSEQKEIIDDVMSTTWEASDSEDLVEEITSVTGFCINSIDYCYVLR